MWIEGKLQGACRHIDNEGNEEILSMKDGVSVSRGSNAVPCYLICCTGCQMIAYLWCFVCVPLGFIYEVVDGSTVPFIVFGGIFYLIVACSA